MGNVVGATVKGKIVGLDLARTVAIALAMISHSLLTTGATTFVAMHYPLFYFVVRLATPMFIILFGALLELVYVNRAIRDGFRSATARLFERSLLCWFLYVITLAPLLLKGETNLKDFLFAAALFGKVPLSDILRYYTVLFAIAPTLLIVRVRWGLAPLLIVSTGFLLVHQAYVAIEAPPLALWHGVPARLSDLIVGVGDAVVGPSVLHSLFFVAVGMVIGHLLQEDRAPDPATRSTITKRFVLLLALLASGAAVSFFIGPEEVSLEAVSNKILRNANHPFYFFNGGLCGAAVIAVLRFVRVDSRGPFRVTMLGQRSLFTFCAGNIFLLLVKERYPLSTGWLLALSTLFLVVIYALAVTYDALMQPNASSSPSRPIREGSRGLRAILDPINQALHVAANWLADRLPSSPDWTRLRGLPND